MHFFPLPFVFSECSVVGHFPALPHRLAVHCTATSKQRMQLWEWLHILKSFSHVAVFNSSYVCICDIVCVSVSCCNTTISISAVVIIICMLLLHTHLYINYILDSGFYIWHAIHTHNSTLCTRNRIHLYKVYSCVAFIHLVRISFIVN